MRGVRARQDAVDDARAERGRDAQVGLAATGADDAGALRGGALERAHDGGADGDDAAAAGARLGDRARGRGGDLERSASGSAASSAGSPVALSPAAWVSEAQRTPRRRSASRISHDSGRPADGISNAQGRAA